DPPDAVLRLEEATAVVGRQGLRRPRGPAERPRGAAGDRESAAEGRRGGDHGGEPGAKKKALGLEDHGRLPPALQPRGPEEAEQPRRGGGGAARRTLGAWGIPGRTSSRWPKEEAWARARPDVPVKPVQPYEALAEERAAVLAYARRHPELRHRELAWRMVDEDVACLSPSTVYRILKEGNLVSPWRRRATGNGA